MPPRRSRTPGASSKERQSAKDAAEQLLGDISRPSPFTILGLAPELVEQLTDTDELLLACGGMYKALSRIHHPDAGGDREQFESVNAAYEQINDAPDAERRRFLALQKTAKSRAKSAPTRVGGGKKVAGTGPSKKEYSIGQTLRVQSYLDTLTPEAVQHIRHAEFLVIPTSVYRADMRAPVKMVTYVRGFGMTVGDSSQIVERVEETEQDNAYTALFQACEADGETHFIYVDESGALYDSQSDGRSNQLGRSTDIPSGWYDLRGADNRRSVTPIQAPAKTSHDPNLVILGSIPEEWSGRFNKGRAAIARTQGGVRESTLLEQLEEGEIEPEDLIGNQSKERTATIFDKRFILSEKDVYKLITGDLPFTGFSSRIKVGDLLIGYDEKTGEGVVLGKVQAQVAHFDD